MRNSFILFLGFVFIVSCSTIDAEETVKAYIAAHNEHNIEKALSFYHPDVIFELKNTWTKNGIEEIKSLEDWDSVLNSNLKLESLQIRGDSAFCKIIENNDWFSAVEINDLLHDPTVFIIEGNKIKKIIAVPSEESGRQIQQVISSVVQWSEETQDSTINQLFLNNQFVYSSEAAIKWMDLFERWKSFNGEL